MSSGEAETWALSRGACDITVHKQLAEERFQLRLSMPRLWTDASTALLTAKRLRTGNRTRHIEISAMFVQELVDQQSLKVGKVPGNMDPANCLTKH